MKLNDSVSIDITLSYTSGLNEHCPSPQLSKFT